LDCVGCKALMSIPELPVCTRLDCEGCINLTSLPELPMCIELECKDCTSLTSLPHLPACTRLFCSNCVNITYINLPDNCFLTCNNSPIAGHNNDLYLSYINARHPVITEAVDKVHNYEKNVVGIIVGYL
jgi:hypothetical protein